MAKEQMASKKERRCFLTMWRLQCSMQWRDADQRGGDRMGAAGNRGRRRGSCFVLDARPKCQRNRRAALLLAAVQAQPV